MDILILVILGTQKQPFKRLLQAIEDSKLAGEILVQSPDSSFNSYKFEQRQFIDYDEMKSLIKNADFVIVHGGTGAITQCLEYGKKVIACARLSKYGEHVDDHQKEIIEVLKDAGYLMELRDMEQLDDVVQCLQTFEPKPFISNNTAFLQRLSSSIFQLTKNK